MCHADSSSQRPVLVLLVAALLAGAGCDSSSFSSSSATAGPPSTPSPSTGPEAGTVALQVVKFNQLTEAIKAQQGKIVVMDIWGTLCNPCKKEFPHLVELSHRYADHDLTCMSVSVDSLEQRDDALKFLQSRKAAFPNFLLDEEAGVWQDKWQVEAIPVVLVYDRAGKQVGKFDNDDPKKQFTYADVEKLVQKLIHNL